MNRVDTRHDAPHDAQSDDSSGARPAMPAWIGLAGPTASGKSSLALALAKHWPIEIVSVDSALVYRGMDIGTAKPTAEEQAQVPHHLIDLLDPAEAYSAAAFARDAQGLIGQIRARGRLPLLVGGTMLYFKALIDGLDDLPAADVTVRAAIDAEATAMGWPALHARLAAVDPVTAARLAPGDAQRIQRALEVWQITGRPLADFHSSPRASAGTAPVHRLIKLEPTARPWLHQRIGQRFEKMLEAGFLDEVARLRRRPGLHTGLPSIRCVGYRQAWEALDRGLTGQGLLDALRERGEAATRQLAKRQLTWLRSLEGISLAADGPDPLAALQRVLASLWHAGPA